MFTTEILFSVESTPWTQNVNWNYLRHLENVLNIFWKLHVRSIYVLSEAVDWRCSVKKMFLEISKNSRENNCVRVSFLIKTLTQLFSCEFCEVSKNTSSYRAPPVADLNQLNCNISTNHIVQITILAKGSLKYHLSCNKSRNIEDCIDD